MSFRCNNRHPAHWPYFGSTLDYIWSQDPNDRQPPGVPRNMFMPFALNSQTNNRMHGGMDAAWLGPEWNPVLPEFAGKATREKGARRPTVIGRSSAGSTPYDGITTESTFRFPGTSPLPDVSVKRLQDRRRLLQQLDRHRRELERTGAIASFDHYQQAAFDTMTSSAANHN